MSFGNPSPSPPSLVKGRGRCARALRAADLLAGEAIGPSQEACPQDLRLGGEPEVQEPFVPARAAGGSPPPPKHPPPPPPGGGVVLEKARRGRPPGTTVTVRNLFKSVPARLKFLKSPATENGRIAQVVAQYVLAWPSVKFTLYVEGRPALRAQGNGGLREAVGEVYGPELAGALLEVQGLGVEGLVGPPSLARSTREYLHFFLHRRPIFSPLLARAVAEAYSGLLPSGRHPVAILHLDLSPEEVDVNIHPQKREVRFRQEWGVFRAVQEAVRRALPSAPPAEVNLGMPL